MGLFNFFGQKNPGPDPYWEFEKQSHFRPALNKVDFFRRTGFDFGWFVVEPISVFVNQTNELEGSKSLSYAQKALYFWWSVDAQVTNGGFVQFYFNGYAPYVSTIIKSLEHIGDTKMAQLIRQADTIFQKKRKLVENARQKLLLNDNLYDKLQDLSKLDEMYYHLNKQTMTTLEQYIRKHPNEVCVDEEGKEIDINACGEYRTFYENGAVKDLFVLDNGALTGDFKRFYETGQLKETIKYSNGLQTGDRMEYYENGNRRYSVRQISSSNQLEHYWFYENGKPQKLEHKRIDNDERIGEYKEWYEGGQLAKTGTYISAFSKDGDWLEYYANGTKKLEAEFKDGKFLLYNFWDEKGNQILKDGTGLYVIVHNDGSNSRYEQEYKDYKRHGEQRSYSNGILSLYQEMQNGVEHGYTRSYYNNGKIKQELLYKNGKLVSSRDFPKFENPRVDVKIISRVCRECYAKEETLQLPDNDPQPTNKEELEKTYKADISSFKPYGDDHVLGCSCVIKSNRKGDVIQVRFSSADNTQIAEEVMRSMELLKFEVAYKDNEPVECIHFVQYKLRLTE